MRTFFTLLFNAIALFPMTVAAQDATGHWRTPTTKEGFLEIKIAPCGAALCGTIVNATNNLGQSGDYVHMGRQMVWDMKPAGEGAWAGGKIWDPRNDRTFNAKMERRGGTLTVSGCFLGICEAQDWTAIQ